MKLFIRHFSSNHFNFLYFMSNWVWLWSILRTWLSYLGFLLNFFLYWFLNFFRFSLSLSLFLFFFTHFNSLLNHQSLFIFLLLSQPILSFTLLNSFSHKFLFFCFIKFLSYPKSLFSIIIQLFIFILLLSHIICNFFWSLWLRSFINLCLS